MSNIKFLSLIGCFVVEGFLSAETCKQLRAEALTSNLEPAKIVNKSDLEILDDEFRRTKSVKISKPTRVALFEQIKGLKTQIENHFNVELAGCEVPQILIYRKGDFFKLHRDTNVYIKVKTRNDDRKISIVIFVNDQGDKPKDGDYCGGLLNLYGLVDQPEWDETGFPVRGRTGLLIAFRSNMLHEVTPVTKGERLTVVNWFF